MIMNPRVWKDCPTHSAMNGLLVWQDEHMISHVCGQTDDHWGEDWKGPIEPCPTCTAHYADIDLEREACAQACIGAYTTGYDYDDIDPMNMKFVGEEEGHNCKHGQFAPEGRCEECCADAIRARGMK